MMRSIAALPTLLMLCGCFAGTVRGLRERTPTLVADTDRSVADVSQCISDTWVAHGMTPRPVLKEGGTTLLVDGGSTAIPLLLIDLDATPAGARVTMWQFKTMWAKQNKARRDEVSVCLTPTANSAAMSR